MGFLGASLVRQLIIATLVAMLLSGCASEGNKDDMKLDAPTMSANEQSKIEGSRHDPEVEAQRQSRPR